MKIGLLRFWMAASWLLVGLHAGEAQAVTIDWVTVGNPGNAGDVSYGGNPAAGAVAYTYRISKYEVTNSQYAEFLNAVAVTDTNGLYNSSMNSVARGGITQSGMSGSFTYSVKTNMGNKPVNYVSFFDAMRFTNWLENGQPTGAQGPGTTEAGVYTIGTGLNETRAGGASYFLPSEDEWYKAAYHQPAANGGDGDNYWFYATRSNTAPTIATANATGDISNPGANVANYSSGADWNAANGNVTTVGSAGLLSESFYGTADQAGNVWEWTEALGPSSSRRYRGSSWLNNSISLSADISGGTAPSGEASYLGFRVASPFSESGGEEVPEPASGLMVMMGASWLLTRRSRNRTTL